MPKKTIQKSKLRMPLGISDFADMIESTDALGNHYTYVDKTLLIRDLIDEPSKVCLMLRPRRFGKTLNLGMLQHFFAAEVYGRATKDLFTGLNITQAGEPYMRHQGRYPVILFSLKRLEAVAFENTYTSLIGIISDLYGEHRYLLDSHKLAADEKEKFMTVLTGQSNYDDLINSLKRLSKYLFQHYQEKVWIFIDEYDTPIHAAYQHDYYEQLMLVMRGLLGSALKDNSYVHKAVLTGILRVSKESLFSELNNIEVYSLLQRTYGEYFGFTEKELKQLIAQADFPITLESIKHWYNGYQAGDLTIYNPWSIISCFKKEGLLEPYWINTSSNALIKQLIAKSKISVKCDFEALIRGETIEKTLDENLVFGDLKHDETALWSFLFLAGYLKVTRSEPSHRGRLCLIAIPNAEVNNLYRRMIETWLADSNGIEWFSKFLYDWLSGDMEHFERRLNSLMLQTFSSFDVESRNPEKFYHGFLLGLTAALMETYQIKSNRESGYGRYDIALFPNDKSQLGVIIECKVIATDDEEKLIELAKQALTQIEDKSYLAEFTQAHIQRVLKIGIGFSGKVLKIAYEFS